MKTIKSEFIGTDATGKDFFRVIIVSESAPDSFPTSGADVYGVPDTAGIAAGSVLLTPDGNSVLYTDSWIEGGTPIVTFVNSTTEDLGGHVAYADSVQAIIDGQVTLIQSLPVGESDVAIPTDMLIAWQPPVVAQIESGDLEAKTDEDSGMSYIEVQGDGVITLTVE